MRDYEVKCKVNASFNVVMQTDGVDMFSAMAKVEKIIRDILINSKIPKDKRDTWPIVVDSQDKIIWIPKVKKSKYNRRKEDNCDIIFKCL